MVRARRLSFFPQRASTRGCGVRQCSAVSKLVYLAGPDVFLPDAADRSERLKLVCTRHGLTGVFPLDTLPDEPACWASLAPARAIALRNEAHIRRADAMIANLTPFRGPGADGGTAYELGFAHGLGCPVFGWSNVAEPYLGRCRGWPGAVLRDGVWRDPDGLEVEAFDLADNLMLACALTGIVVAAPSVTDPWSDLVAYEQCVMLVAGALGAG